MRWPWFVLTAIAAAIVVIVGWQIWDSHWQPDAMWIDTDRPDCQAWNAQPQRNETVTWSGSCQSGKAEGAGVLTWGYIDSTGHAEKETETYSGSLLGGKQNGRATTISSIGSRYDGEYRDGQKSGQGVLTWPDAKYDGAWKDGKPHGSGTYTEGGLSHQGQWEQGCLDDKGSVIGLGTKIDECLRILGKAD
jgi:hypothetical protein